MALVPYENLFKHVQPYVPGCPESIIVDHLAEAAATFCVGSEIWRFDIESETTLESTYLIDIPTGAVLEDIVYLEVDGMALRRLSDKLAFTADEGAPMAYAIYQDQNIRFYPTPDKAYTYQGIGVLKPALSSAGLEDFLYESHGRTIAYGALAKLLEIPGKEWANPMQAQLAFVQFRRGVDAAKMRDYRKVPMRPRARQF